MNGTRGAYGTVQFVFSRLFFFLWGGFFDDGGAGLLASSYGRRDMTLSNLPVSWRLCKRRRSTLPETVVLLLWSEGCMGDKRQGNACIPEPSVFVLLGSLSIPVPRA